MKVKTSITLSEKTLSLIDIFSKDIKGKSRSELIEAAILAFIRDKQKQRRDEEDLKLITKHAKQLNEEADDALSYQQGIW